MTDIKHGRWAAADGEPMVLFLIGTRINRWRAVSRWRPVVAAMPRMLKELAEAPARGLLGWRTALMPPREIMVVQYWRSFEALESYARAAELAHLPAWRAFNRSAKDAGGAVGIWHETYVIGAHAREAVYVDMPPFGLGKATGLVPASGARAEARGRLAGTAAAESSTRPPPAIQPPE